MSRRLPRIDRSKVRTVSARRRRSKVALADEAKPHRAGARFSEFLAGLAAGIGATPATVAGAVRGADLVILAIPTRAIPLLAPGLLGELAGDAVVVDTGNYHPELRDGPIAAMDRGMPDSVWVARQLGRPVRHDLDESIRYAPRQPAGVCPREFGVLGARAE